MNNKDNKSISEKYAEIMRYANLVISPNSNQKDLSQPSPLEVVESCATNNCSDINLIKMENYYAQLESDIKRDREEKK